MSQANRQNPSWKSRFYVLGTAIGAVLGLLSAYLFASQAESEEDADERPDVSPIVVLGLATSVLSVIRQIAESGKKNKDKDKERKG